MDVQIDQRLQPTVFLSKRKTGLSDLLEAVILSLSPSAVDLKNIAQSSHENSYTDPDE